MKNTKSERPARCSRPTCSRSSLSERLRETPKTDAVSEEIRRNNWRQWVIIEKMEEHAKTLERSNNKLRHQRRLLLKRVKEMGSDLAESRRIAKDACAMLASEGYEVNYPPMPWEADSPENAQAMASADTQTPKENGTH